MNDFSEEVKTQLAKEYIRDQMITFRSFRNNVYQTIEILKIDRHYRIKHDNRTMTDKRILELDFDVVRVPDEEE